MEDVSRLYNVFLPYLFSGVSNFSCQHRRRKVNNIGGQRFRIFFLGGGGGKGGGGKFPAGT